tara:strand:- start:1630 stop:2967 length:1338 start_codon:yes stop_codon:yes gene_type:complete
MAADLTGMFAQMNKAILAQPLASGVPLDVMSKGVGNLAGNLSGGAIDNYSMMTPAARQSQGRSDLAEQDLSTAAGMENAANIYGKMGNNKEAMAAGAIANDRRIAEDLKLKEQKTRESLARRATAVGRPGLAGSILAGASDIPQDQKTITELETEKLVIKGGIAARRALATNAGINKEQFDAQDLGELTVQQFQNVLSGRKGDAKAYQMQGVGPVSMRTNEYGYVFDPKDNTWKEPSAMGLSANVALQKITNISNTVVERLALGGVDNFIDLYTNVKDDVVVLDIIDRNLALIPDMATGATAPIEQWMLEMGAELGVENTASNQQEYMANIGKLVGKEITAFGSGTGLSDKDMEFAKDIAGANPVNTPEALTRILKMRKQAILNMRKQFTDTKDFLRKSPFLSGQAEVLDAFIVPEQTATATPVSEGYWDIATGAYVYPKTLEVK